MFEIPLESFASRFNSSPGDFTLAAHGHHRTFATGSSKGNTRITHLPSNTVSCRRPAKGLGCTNLAADQDTPQENVMAEPFPDTLPSEKPAQNRLDSWKEIATYLNRDVTTVQRWKKREGMPVHRHLHDKRGSVYGLTSELDAWQLSRSPRLEEEEEIEKRPDAEAPIATRLDSDLAAIPWTRLTFALAGLAVLALLAFAYLRLRSRPADTPTQNHIPRRPSSEESVPRSFRGIPRRRVDRGSHRTPLRHPRFARRLAHLGDALQRSSSLGSRVARTLGVDAIVEGSVIQEGDRIRVTAQLIRGRPRALLVRYRRSRAA